MFELAWILCAIFMLNQLPISLAIHWEVDLLLQLLYAYSCSQWDEKLSDIHNFASVLYVRIILREYNEANNVLGRGEVKVSQNIYSGPKKHLVV